MTGLLTFLRLHWWAYLKLSRRFRVVAMIRFPKLTRMRMLLAAMLLQGLAVAAHATPVYTVQATTDADLGPVTSGVTGDTVFRVDAVTGSVTTISGTATRSAGGTTRAVVTIHCAAQASGDCTKNLNIRLGVVGSPIGRGRVLTRVLFSMGTAQLVGSPGSPGSPTFSIAAIGPNASKTFYVGADFGIAGDDSGLPTGHAEADFFVWAAEAPSAPTTGDVGRFEASVFRSIAISKTSDLVFGRIMKPATGLGTVTVDATTGVRTSTGATSLDTPTPTRASFNVTGEGGQAFTITLPASFQINGPQPLTVTTSSTATGSPVLSSGLGSAGSYAFGVGGSLPIGSSTPDGDYSGNFTVTVAYN